MTILELRDVKYFFDGKNYYKKIDNHITKDNKRRIYNIRNNTICSRKLNKPIKHAGLKVDAPYNPLW